MLEYTNTRLTKLLTPSTVPDVLAFLDMLDTALSSTHLSASLVRDFAHSLASLALRLRVPASPLRNAAAVVLGVVYNLCIRHADACMHMIHDDGTAGGSGSLWSVATLGEHYVPCVSATARRFSRPFRNVDAALGRGVLAEDWADGDAGGWEKAGVDELAAPASVVVVDSLSVF